MIKKIAKIITLETLFLGSLVLFSLSCYWLASAFPFFKDLSKTHALSNTTRSLLEQFSAPIQLHLYTHDLDKHHQIAMLVERYTALHPNIEFRWHQEITQQYGVPSQVLIVRYEKQQQTIDLDKKTVDENVLTSTLFKLQRQANQWIVFLQGHDEPNPFGTGDQDFSLLRLGLENQGLRIQRLFSSLTPFIADNTQVLVVGAPKSTLLPKEEQLLVNYIEQGKDLLWLIDPQAPLLSGVSQVLGVYPLPGTIADLHGQKLGTTHPAITVIGEYPELPFQAPGTLTVFPWATALKVDPSLSWKVQPLLMSHELTWTEMGNLSNTVDVNEPHANKGPLLLGVCLTRANPLNPKDEQRVAIIGNSRFLRNGAIENYGNLALGLNLFNWLSHDDLLLHIAQPVGQDAVLQLHLITAILIEYGFVLLPLLFFAFTMLWFLRRIRTSRKIASALTHS